LFKRSEYLALWNTLQDAYPSSDEIFCVTMRRNYVRFC